MTDTIRENLITSTYASAVEYFSAFCKNSFILNSATSISLLTLAGAGSQSETIQSHIMLDAALGSLPFSLIGVVAATISMIFAYFTQRRYYLLLLDTQNDVGAIELAKQPLDRWAMATLGLLVASVGFFIWAVSRFYFSVAC